MKPVYFKTKALAYSAIEKWADAKYPNKFQDAQSIARATVREFKCGFAIQLGDYGPYLTAADFEVTA